MTQAIISVLSGSSPICLPINQNNNTALLLKQQLCSITAIPVQDQVLSTMGGLLLNDHDLLNSQQDIIYLNVSGRLLGGKGGFGSMLRAQGGRMNAQKTTNFEACRDLQGRRIKTVNDAKKLQEELDALPEREAEKREKLKRKIEDALKEREPRKYLFDDNKFLEDREEMVENVKSAVDNAIKRQKVSHKPAASTSASLFDDDVSSEEDEEEDEEEEEEEEEEQESEVEETEEKESEEEETEEKESEEEESEAEEGKKKKVAEKKKSKGKGKANAK